MSNPVEIEKELIAIFPEFSQEVDTLNCERKEFEYDFGYIEPKTRHEVWRVFAESSLEIISCSNVKTIKKLCVFINDQCESGGDMENSVSTCFLEHASQIGVRKLIKPYLNGRARDELR